MITKNIFFLKIMVSSGFFIAMIVLSIILLIIITIASIYGAVALSNSAYFSTDNRVKTAHSYLTASSVIGSIILFILFIVIFYILIKNPFSQIQITEAFISNSSPTAKDIALAFLSEKKLKEGESARLIILVMFIIITFMVLLLAILCLLASYQMSQVLVRDQKAIDGANAAFVGAIAGIVEVFLIFIVTIFSYSLKSEAQTDTDQLDKILAPAATAAKNGTGTGFKPSSTPAAAAPKKQVVVTQPVVQQVEKPSNYQILCSAYPDNPFCQ